MSNRHAGANQRINTIDSLLPSLTRLQDMRCRSLSPDRRSEIAPFNENDGFLIPITLSMKPGGDIVIVFKDIGVETVE